MSKFNDFPEGTKIYNASGTEYGVVISVGDWHCACGRNGKVKVLWNDGEKTLCCIRALETFKDGFKIVN